ncbi:MAG: cohesin domain-containing protein, partial [Gallionella sp.]
VPVTIAKPPIVAIVGEPIMEMSWLGPMQAKKGGNINLTLNGQSDKGFNGLSFAVNYDPSALKLNEVQEGNYWKNSKVTPKFTKIINPKKGQVVIDVTQSPGLDSTKGQGSITTLNFDVIGGQTQSSITVTSIQPIDDSGAGLSATAPKPHNLRLRP